MRPFRLALAIALIALVPSIASAATARLVTRVIAAADNDTVIVIPPTDSTSLGFRVTQIDVISASPCATIICPDDSIRVIVRGMFPNPCWSVKSFDALPIIDTSIHPPVLRLVVDDGSCLDRLCLAVPQPFSVDAVIPRLGPGRYTLETRLHRTDCTDSVLAAATRLTPFVVSTTCADDNPCFTHDWTHPNGYSGCDAKVAPGDTAGVEFRISTDAPLAGLQGDFRIVPRNLRIRAIQTTGIASNMTLAWTPSDDGARFVLFANVRGGQLVGDNQPILRVIVERPERSAGRELTTVIAENLLGSTKTGGVVSPCLPSPCARFALPRATVCLPDLVCDTNGDGHSDVRDLVLMVQCLADPLCGIGDVRHFDCNADNTFALEDVICCARHVLNPAVCSSCGDDSLRSERDVRIAFGEPVYTETGIDVPVQFFGFDRVGAGRVTIRYPHDVFELDDLDLTSGDGWLMLDERSDGAVKVGIIGLSIENRHATTIPGATLHLKLRQGRVPSGQVQATEAEFSGPDGTRLEIGFASPTLRIGGPPSLAFSANQPNPFSGSTSFTLTLDRPGDVEVGVYDIGGRLVASVHDGVLAAGAHPLTWNGTSGGKTARGGIYFLRATSGGVVVNRKIVRLGN